MRITFILDRLNLGGAERHTLNLSRALASRGHEVQIIVLFSGGSGRFPVEDFPTAPLCLEAAGLMSKGMVGRLKTALTEFSPDTVFAINQSAMVAATLACLRGKVPRQLCCIFHTTEIASRLGQLRTQLFKWCTARADALIFVSRLQRAYWSARGMRAHRVFAIQNGIHTDQFLPATPEARAQMRAQLHLEEHHLAITLVGRFSQEKNHAWLIRVLSELRKADPEAAAMFRLVFIGEGEERPHLETLITDLGLQDVVIFAGSHRDIRPVLAVADVGALVSNAVETFSLAALELMSSGLPMIMTEIGGAAEILVDGEQGYLIPRVGDAGLANALLAMKNPGRRAGMGMAARNRVLEQFTYDRMVDEYEAIVTDPDRIQGTEQRTRI